jgi:uncharacterized membrane protein
MERARTLGESSPAQPAERNVRVIAQNRMTRQADKRAHLDLQVDLLAEQELTTMLQMLDALCRKLQVHVKIADTQMLDETDVQKLASSLESELPVK